MGVVVKLVMVMVTGEVGVVALRRAVMCGFGGDSG